MTSLLAAVRLLKMFLPQTLKL